MDPIFLLASAFGGAVVTAAIGLLTFIMTGRREHRRWLYDLKYKNYLEVLRAWHNWEQVVTRNAGRRQDEVHPKMMELVAADLVLVYSLKVERSFTALVDDIIKQNNEITIGERKKFDLEHRWINVVNSMRKDLGIRETITGG